MIVHDQSPAEAFLAAAMSEQGPVEVVETHISHLVLGPTRVWKLKRAVRLPYADFTSPERRLACCRREVELNRRTAPDHYLGVRRITEEPAGLALDGPGPLVDAVVEMLRFDQSRLLDRMAVRGALTAEVIERLAVAIADFHARCAADLRHGSDRVAEVLAVNETALAETAVFPRDEVARFNAAFRAAAGEHRNRLDARGRVDRVRLAHGDLHLRNVLLDDERPVLFDYIEFNDAIATVDLLYDVAFLLMDLVHRGLPDLANVVMNRYLDLADDEADMPLIPFFMALRAAVRAHVAATAVEEGDDKVEVRAEAHAYFELALDLLRPQLAVIVAFGDLSGSGKSTVASAFALRVGRGTGARTLLSDRLRKALYAVAADARLPSEAYSREVSARVCEALAGRAGALASASVSVVADAVFAAEAERRRIADAARAARVPFRGFWLDAPADVLRARVAARRGGPSDATVAVLERQLGYDLGRLDWVRLDATEPPNVLAEAIKCELDKCGSATRSLAMGQA